MSSILQASLINPDIMTRVTSYLIFLSNSSSSEPSLEEAELVATVGGASTTHSLTILENGTYLVGVAAENAAGRSDNISYHRFGM